MLDFFLDILLLSFIVLVTVYLFSFFKKDSLNEETGKEEVDTQNVFFKRSRTKWVLKWFSLITGSIFISLFSLYALTMFANNYEPETREQIAQNESTTITGVYNDFDRWSEGYSGEITVNITSYSGYIEWPGGFEREYYSGKVIGNKLISKVGEQSGYIEDGKLYFYFLNDYYPILKQ